MSSCYKNDYNVLHAYFCHANGLYLKQKKDIKGCGLKIKVYSQTIGIYAITFENTPCIHIKGYNYGIIRNIEHETFGYGTTYAFKEYEKSNKKYFNNATMVCGNYSGRLKSKSL